MEFPRKALRWAWCQKQSSSVLSYFCNQSDRKTLPWRHFPPNQPNTQTFLLCNIPTDPKLTSSFPREGFYPQNLLPHKFLKLLKWFLLSLLISLPLVQLSSSHSPCSVRGNLWHSSSGVCHPSDSQQIQQTGCAGVHLFGTDTLQPPSKQMRDSAFPQKYPPAQQFPP